MNDFIRALEVFDNELDRLARENKNTIVLKYDNSAPCDCSCSKNNKNDLELNNIMDDIKQVIFNDPATIVTFSDGTKVCVKACSKDKFDKEVGLMYALVKRLYANDVDENGYMKSTGLGEKINKIIKNAVDQKELAKQKAEAKAAKKEANYASKGAGEKAKIGLFEKENADKTAKKVAEKKQKKNK